MGLQPLTTRGHFLTLQKELDFAEGGHPTDHSGWEEGMGARLPGGP